MRVADLAGPAAAQLREVEVAALDDAQGIEQMRGEEFGAAAVVGSVASERMTENLPLLSEP